MYVCVGLFYVYYYYYYYFLIIPNCWRNKSRDASNSSRIQIEALSNSSKQTKVFRRFVLHLSEASCFTSQYLGRFFFYIFISAAPSLFPFLVLAPQLLAIVNLIHQSHHSQLPLFFLAFKFHSLLSFLLSYSDYFTHSLSTQPNLLKNTTESHISFSVHVGNDKSLQ